MKTRTGSVPAILAALAVSALPHVRVLPAWIMVWCAVCWGYVYLLDRLGRPWPGKWIRRLLTLGGFFGALYFYGGVDRETGAGLICMMAGLKPLELRTYRDRMVAIFLAYFLIIPVLLFTGSLAIMLHMILATLFTTAVLIRLHHTRGKLWGRLLLSGRIMGMALPLVFILFLLFPRAHGGFWSLPRGVRGQSGFSERLAPGDISSLARNREIAFRAEFEEGIPTSDLLYWRGLVFWNFDGRQWTPGMRLPGSKTQIIGENPITYTITLEPHHEKWLFALDIPFTTIRRWTSRTAGHTLRSIRSVKRRARYTLRSYTRYIIDPKDPWQERGLILPKEGNPVARALGRTLSSAEKTPRRIMNAGLMFFKENEFQYTLEPEPLGRNRIDEFLFETREGYCEHFASAYAFLMRAAGVPARIVAGYQGGEVNPYGEYLVIRQSDAHVWVEVWLGKEGWTRADPTAMAVPERVESGAEEALPDVDRLTWLAIDLPAPFDAWWKQVRFGWDALNTQWIRWVMGYTKERQRSLLSRIGIGGGSMKGLLLWLCAPMVLICVLISAYCVRLLKRSAVKTDAIQAAYLKFCEKLAKIGIPRSPGAGPMDYARRITRTREDIAAPAREIIDLYIRLRYEEAGDGEDLKRLRRLVRQFKPRPGSPSPGKR